MTSIKEMPFPFPASQPKVALIDFFLCWNLELSVTYYYEIKSRKRARYPPMYVFVIGDVQGRKNCSCFLRSITGHR